MQFLTEIVVIAAMLGLNALFAAYEMALAAVSLPRLKSLATTAGRAGEHALFMKERMERSLAVVQLGITLAGAVAAATGGAGAEEFFSPRIASRFGLSAGWSDALALALIVLPLSAASIVFAELVPKMIALQDPERVVLRLSTGFRWLSAAFYPAIWFFEVVVKAITGLFHVRARNEADPAGASASISELLAAASLARGVRAIGGMEEQIVRAAAQLSSRRIGEIGIPLAEVSTIPADSSLADALIAAHLHMHTRYPVTRPSPDGRTEFVGYVNFKDIVSALRVSPGEPGFASIIRPIKNLPASVSISHALEQILREKSHIALLTDESGRAQAVITLEDILEELIGDIGDEYDRLLTHIHPHSASWFVGGGSTIAAVRRSMDLPAVDPVQGNMRLAEWFATNGGNEALPGARLVRDGMEVEVRKVRKRHLMEAVIRRA